MRSYYVRRKKYYFIIEKERRKQKLIIAAFIALSAITVFAGLQLVPALFQTNKKPENMDEKVALAKKDKGSEEKKQNDAQPDNVPKVAIVIDDVGFVQANMAKFQEIKIPLTFSVIPHTKYGKANAELFHSLGQEIIIHLPMENDASGIYEPGEINTKMSDQEIIAALDQQVVLVPNAKGINNHEGKVATTDKRVVDTVLRYAKGKGLFFLDSLTTPNSVVCQTQGEIGMPKRVNDLFIDNIDNLDAIKVKIQELGIIARSRGIAIGIGHIQKANTAQAIIEMAPVLQSQGVKFIFLSQTPSNR